jgi:VWFA-related protein
MLTVTVTDRDGRYVADLRPEDFVVYEEDLPQSLTYFNTGQNEPVSLGLIMDTSGSMLRKMGRARQALRLLADTIQVRDEVFLEAFNSAPILVQDFTDSRALVLQAAAQLQPDGDTALYDAILDGLHRVQKGRCQKKALVVLTDGVDTSSRASLGEVQTAIRGTSVLVYTIGIGNPNIVKIRGGRPMGLIGPMGGFGPISKGPLMVSPGQLVDEAVDSQTLQAISEETGAKHFLLNTADVLGNGATLERAASTIVTELRQQYSLGYRSPLKGDVYRDVRVETRRAGVIVRTQKGVD